MRLLSGKRGSIPIAQPSANNCSGLIPVFPVSGPRREIWTCYHEDELRTDFRGELDDSLVAPDDLFALLEVLDGDLGLDVVRELVDGVDGPVLAVQRDDGVVRPPICLTLSDLDERIMGSASTAYPVTASTNWAWEGHNQSAFEISVSKAWHARLLPPSERSRWAAPAAPRSGEEYRGMQGQLSLGVEGGSW